MVRLMATGLLVSAGIAVAGESVELTLTRDGKAAASIVIAKEPTRSASFAARELQCHLKQITGAEVPIEEVPSAECRMEKNRTARFISWSERARPRLPRD